MIEVKESNDKQFPIYIKLSNGVNKFTEKAAYELLDKLRKLLPKRVSKELEVMRK